MGMSTEYISEIGPVGGREDRLFYAIDHTYHPGATPGVQLAHHVIEEEERRRQLVEVEERIASLQTDIAASEEALKVLIAIPVPEGGGPLAMADDPQFREVAGEPVPAQVDAPRGGLWCEIHMGAPGSKAQG